MIEIYEDKELTRKVPSGHGAFILDLGEAEVGEIATRTFYVYNPGPGVLANLEFISEDDRVTISGPIGLEEKEKSELIIKWKPAIAVKRGLKAGLRIEGKIIYGPPEEG